MIRNIESIAHRLGFTKHEAIAIIFLTMVITTGALLQTQDGIPDRPSFRQAYQRHDSTFAAHTAARIPATVTHSDNTVDLVPLGDTLRRVRLIDINTADTAELTQLPGIGPATAKKIVAYRYEVGKFKKIEDIMKVKSIGRKKFERMNALICVD